MYLFDRLMTHKVDIYRVEVDAFGDETFLYQSTERCFFEYNERRKFTRDGTEVTSTALLFLPHDSAYDPSLDGQRWQFIDVKNNRTLQLLEPQIIDDPRTGRTHHYELFLQ